MDFFKKFDIDYLVTLLFLLLTANSSILSANNICYFVGLGFMWLVAIIKKDLTLKDITLLSVFSIIFLAFVGIRDTYINNLSVQFLLSDGYFLVKYIFLSFIFCTILKQKASIYIVRVTVHLTVLSLILFFFQVIGLNDYIYNFSTWLNLKSDNLRDGYTNFIFYSYTKGVHDFRNSGFLWEPGSFGCFLIIALLLHFFSNKFTFDKKANILIIGILTTFSTTNYLALLVIFFLTYRIKVPKLNWWVIVIALGIASLIILVPFLWDKISDSYYEDMDDLNKMKYLAVFYMHKHGQIPLNRFASMVYIVDTFRAYLILGMGNKYNAILNEVYDINISNGLFDFIAKYGLVGIGFLIYKYSKFCIACLLKWEYVIYCILALLIIGFGEPIIGLPIALMFLFLPENQLTAKMLRLNKIKVTYV